MSFARGVWARSPFAGGPGTEVPPAPGHQQIPPPIPGGTGRWIYTPNPVLAWAGRPWAGRTSLITFPGGGISIAPQAARGVMTIAAWWPDTPTLSLRRHHADGSSFPVRRGSPLEVPSPTRANLCPNPSFELGLNGYVQDVGSPTFSQEPGGPRGAHHLRATIAAAGSCGITVPSALTAGKEVTVAVDLRLSARPTSAWVQIGWADAAGVALPISQVLLTANQINYSIEQWARQVTVVPTPAGAVTPTVKIIAAGLPADATMDLDGVTLERGRTDGTYFDGATAGATWTGPDGLSTSVLAPVMTLDDPECPLDQLVHYSLTSTSPTGGTIVSAGAVLPSLGRSWLTHPGRAVPITTIARRPPVLVRTAVQGVHHALDRPRPVVVSARTRRAPSGTFDFNSLSWSQRDQLLDLFADQAPILLRTPARYGYGAGMWISLGDLTEDPEDHLAYHDTRLLSAPFYEVDAPAT